MSKKFSSIRGTTDFNTLETSAFNDLTQKARKILSSFFYEEIILPILEEQGLFSKGVGEASDIVQRQMFKIEGKDTVLRPEGTAGVIRFYLEHSLFKKSDFYKFFYIGPMFRGERPQKGRLRQFNHIGAEAIGSDNVYLDAEIISLLIKVLDKIGVNDRELLINTLGCSDDKEVFNKTIFDALKGKKDSLCENCQSRLQRNPLRVLDCKQRNCRQTIESLKLRNTHLCKKCLKSFEELLSILDSLGIEYTSDPYLVRGLDYYTNTVFEVRSAKIGSQDAIAAGGRYNNLVKYLGGPDMPAIGFAIGIERVLLLLANEDRRQRPDVFIALTNDSLASEAFGLLNKLRNTGLTSDCDYCGKSLKGQLRVAQRKGFQYVIIIGEEEIKDKTVVLKNMQKNTQSIVDINKLIDLLNKKQ